ncbi:MAG: hypothetical protein LC107_06235 [Chitinophagales bacterium]|nr:hypothetical protein [Chitinophagales bacterium]
MSRFFEDFSDLTSEQIRSFFPDCNRCKHYLGNAKCKAYDDIPDEIITNNSHKEVRPDQKGQYVFEEKVKSKVTL